ncbi:MAG: tetratricopeptide repeat protein [Candidatus Omnitrophica bacterium]|nr:tetratricopeptide repeat protein [Candidatus Omnitrophota bacterium]
MNTPNAATSLYNEALKDHARGDLVASQTKLQQALTLSPDYEDALEALAVLLFNVKHYDESITVIRRWIKINPNAIMAQTNLSRCYVAKGMILEAENAQAEARRLSWKSELETKKKDMPAPDFEDRITRYKKVIGYDPKDVLGYFSLGSVYLEASRFRDAADVFEKGIEVDPTHSASYLNWGIAVQGLGDKIKAQKIWLNGIEAAKARGDMLTEKKMESHLRALEKPPQD